MLRRVRITVLPLALLGLAASGCRPLIDGGWDGTARCGNDALPLSAVFNESSDGEVNGFVHIEGFSIFGEIIVKGVIEDGERNPDDGSYEFQLQTDDDQPAEFDVELEYADDDFEELEGRADALNDDGEVTDSCTVDLERVSVND